MDHEKQKRMTKASEQITQRMEKSRREIALLKADYERLIERGVRDTSSNITDTDKQKEIQNKREEAGPSRGNSQHPKGASGRGALPKSPDPVVIPKSARIKSYNVEEAREFMRKQKEKRLQQQKQVKEPNNALEVKKQKLQELHKKSLLIVTRNRERSKSRERLKAVESEIPASKTSLSLTEAQNQDYTAKKSEKQMGKNSSFNHLPAKSDDAKIKAATLIQAWFRGHKQRKLYQLLLEQRRQTKLQRKAKEVEAKPKNPREFEEAKHRAANDLPEWLQEGPAPSPYTFINSVKRKLKYLSTPPVKTVDVGVQKSRTEELFTPQRSAKEVRALIEQNMSSKKSESKFSEKVEQSVKSMNYLQVPNELERSRHSRIEANAGALDNKRLDSYKLKTKTDASDSDTSNNIPDFSSESQFDSYHTSSSLRKSIQSAYSESVFKKPNQPPAKPQRLLKNITSRREREKSPSHHSSSSSSGSSKENMSKTSNPSQDSTKSENILNINTDRLRMMKLDRGGISVQSLPEANGSISEDISKSAGTTSSIHTKIDLSNPSDKESEQTKEVHTPKKLFGSKPRSRSNSGSRTKSSKKLIGTLAEKSTNDGTTGFCIPSSVSSSSHCLRSDSKRQSFIAGNICQFPRSVPSFHSEEDRELTNDDLHSFRAYKNNVNQSSKITYTPFQPKKKGAFKRDTAAYLDLLTEQIRKFDQMNANDTNKLTEIPAKDSEKDIEDIAKLPEDLIAPKDNSNCKNADKSRKTTTATQSLSVNGNNQILVKFQADLHLLNDFNQSLRQIENIEKSMLELETKCIQTSKPEMRDANTSAMSSNSFTNPSSIIEKSINFSRGSDFPQELNKSVPFPQCHQHNQQLVVQALESSVKYDESLVITDNSLFEVSDIRMKNTTALTLESTESQLDKSIHKIHNPCIPVEMYHLQFDQIIKDEDARLQHIKTVLKQREKILLDRTKIELRLLEFQRTNLLQTGKLHEASLLKKKQRGIVLKLQEERNEMLKMKQMQKSASKERKTLLKAQCSAIKAQLTSAHRVPKLNRTSVITQRKYTGPVKVYNYQSETSVSRKSSLESVLFTSHSESVLSKESEDEVESLLVAKSTTTDVAKRILQKREVALQKRKQDAKELLQWHQELLVEERKIVRLEMAAANLINQVTIPGVDKLHFLPAHSQDVRREGSREESDKGRAARSRTSVDSKANSSYSMDFEAKEVSLENGIKESESTLNEIMHNINNITDEIAELYKLSSVPLGRRSNTADKKVDSVLPLDRTQAETVSESKPIESESVSSTCHETFKQIVDLSPTNEVPNNKEQENRMKEIALQEEVINQETEQDVSSIKDDFEQTGNHDPSIIEEYECLEISEIVSRDRNENNIKSVSQAIDPDNKLSNTEEVDSKPISNDCLVIPTSNDEEICNSVPKEVPQEDIPEELEENLNVSTSTDASTIASLNFKSEDVLETQIIPVTNVKLKERQFNAENESNLESQLHDSAINIRCEDFDTIEELKQSQERHPNKDLNEANNDLESVSSSLTSIVDEPVTDKKDDSTSTDKQIDVKKRVSEILADAHLNTSIEEKSPRLPDIYVTTYDVISPDNSPELGSPVDNLKSPPKQQDIYGIGNEAQELLKKQLAIEQEIKQIEQQQKENRPYIFREIPNKPPPPYTPPIQSVPVQASIVPTSMAQIKEVLPQFVCLFYQGYLEHSLEKITFPTFRSSIDKSCAEFLFDICKELATKHYQQFEHLDSVAWMQISTFKRPFTQSGLQEMLERNLSQLFGFEKVMVKESMLMKWSRKKRDYVDELLVTELQAEESEWTNFDMDELIVKDEVTKSLLSLLLAETATIFQNIYAKRSKH